MHLIVRVTLFLALCACALAFAPSPTYAAPPNGSPEPYVVQAGDTLFSIAQRFHTTVAALKKLNNLTGDTIQVGQKLVVPATESASPAAVPAPASTYIVQNGDTLYRIALRYGTTPRALMELNGIPNPNLIAPGQALAIPASATFVKPGLTIDPLTARQGSTVLIRIARPNLSAVSGKIGSQTIAFTRAAGYFYALVGISRCAKIGNTPLTLTQTDTAGEVKTESARIVIAATAFPVQALTLPASKTALLDQTLIKKESEQVDAIVERVTPTRLWSGAFRLPVSGPITSPFGTRRSYNGGPVGACGHEGTDFDMEQGDPVYAAARGHVAFAAPTQVRGNLILLDHGLGVFTGYYHLSQISVQTGQWVEVGDVIGQVGSTGLSTGPHLHWSMWISGEYVDPLEWTRRVLPYSPNHPIRGGSDGTQNRTH